jgi:hypothetical protein
MRTRRFSVQYFSVQYFSVQYFSMQCSAGGLVLLVCAGGLAMTAGCSNHDVVSIEEGNVPALSTGQLQLALTARGSSGSLYRLRHAEFLVQELDPFGGFATVLSSENDPLASTLEATLETGDYVVDLFPGWFLEKVIDGVATQVVANLVSSSSLSFSILANEESRVSYRFETNGEIIEFSQGRLIIQIEVEERSSEVTLGEPLDIVAGFISGGSNLHGIEAALFSVTSPLNANIQVTSDTGSICVQGDVGIVQNEDFANQWGALFGFDLTLASGGAPWDLDGGNVVGFAYTLSGSELPPLRFAAQPGGSDPTVDNFCQILDAFSGASLQSPFNALDRNCWEAMRNPMVADSLTNVNWTIPADSFVPHSFDFCVSDLRPILR